MAKPRGPVELKVYAGVVGTGLGVGISNALLWFLGVVIWGADYGAKSTDVAIAAVPSPVADLIKYVVTALIAGVAAYAAPHTHRPDLVEPVQPEPIIVESKQKRRRSSMDDHPTEDLTGLDAIFPKEIPEQ